MPSYQKRKRADGRVAWVAWVRLKPFKATSRSFPSKEEAREWAERHERELKAHAKRGVRHDVTRLTLKGLTEEYLKDPETKALSSYQWLADYLAWWVNEYAAERVLDWNVLKLREARGRLQKGRAPATVNRHLSALRGCWNWGRSSGLVPQELAWPSRLMLTEPPGRTRFLTAEELARLLECSADHSPEMHALVVVSIGCGVRQSELLRLRWSDVDLDRNRLRVLLSKNGESRSVYLPKAAADALRVLKARKLVALQVFVDAEGKPLGNNWREHRWRSVRKSAGLTDFRWHDLRHSCASFLAQQGASLLEIGSVLGHKSPSMTRRYAHLVEGAPVTGSAQVDEMLRTKPPVQP